MPPSEASTCGTLLPHRIRRVLNAAPDLPRLFHFHGILLNPGARC